MDHSDPIAHLLQEGVQTRVFPGAVLLIRHHGRIRLHQGIGSLSHFPDSPPVLPNTIYDLASLTKPLATVSAILLLIQEGLVGLEDPLHSLLEETKGVPLGKVPLRHFLSHQSGLPAYRAYFQEFSPSTSSQLPWRQEREKAFLRKIIQEPLARASAPVSVYSDLGFMVLGFVIKRATRQSLEEFCQDRIFTPLGARPMGFRIPLLKGAVSAKKEEIAPTEEDPWRGYCCQGEVHDENAHALGGAAGHAGLFGTVEAVAQVTKAWLDSFRGRPGIFDSKRVKEFCSPQPNSSWGLGWDTPSQPSSSGQFFSGESFGHLGFTGTSIWIDPTRELEVVFLSNRVHPTRNNQAIKTFRPKLHDLIIQECERTP